MEAGNGNLYGDDRAAFPFLFLPIGELLIAWLESDTLFATALPVTSGTGSPRSGLKNRS